MGGSDAYQHLPKEEVAPLVWLSGVPASAPHLGCQRKVSGVGLFACIVGDRLGLARFASDLGPARLGIDPRVAGVLIYNPFTVCRVLP